MSDYDLVIRNGTVATAADTMECDVGIKDGIVGTLGRNLGPGTREIDAAGKLVSDNFYWLSTKPDTLDWKKRRGTAYTPQKDYGDITALSQLPAVKLTLTERVFPRASKAVMHVTVKNPSKEVAFMVHLRLTRGKGGEDVVPVFWDDNYVTLLPGEHCELTATYEPSALAGAPPVVEVDGWNVETAQR